MKRAQCAPSRTLAGINIPAFQKLQDAGFNESPQIPLDIGKALQYT
jgi:hypothetical protein